ncbi:hypothetical protein CCAX7_000800 [Capsulimonas corticalis]|uniref:Uncharacterized protein n=1 Tax=Capsulimonas corticalis TaxID=2219043 RepID=A0A402CRA4_9BACT|nr:Gfo/Idh/MocA family oxidoreductase [Capsulimonas corticalis]BDI28029.1 hypothetical protein CCAX7_000800 [Capsulimonas corticalis]
MTNPIEFAIVGAGWRAEFYLRIAREMPERFRVSGVLARSEAKAQKVREEWGVPVVADLDSLLRDKPLFAVASVPWDVNPGVLTELARRGTPALSETPPAPDLAGLIALAGQLRESRTQVAEQYQFQPWNAAVLSVIDSGKLGAVTQAQVSVAHGYHGISLLRKALGVGFENAAIRALAFTSPLTGGPDRSGPPTQESIGPSHQTHATLEFEGKLGVFDFCDDQYFSWVRSRRLLVRGERGEINNGDVRFLQDFQTPIHAALTRVDAGQDGNLEGYFHQGILCGSEWVYRNPFAPGRLADDEIAIAACLQKMADYAEGGPSFYGLAEASQDHYLSMEIQRAAASRETVTTVRQSWAD